MTLNQAVERIYSLNVGITPIDEGPPHERPHKPVLLLAVFDLLDIGHATPDYIPWSQELRDHFTSRFLIVKKHNDQNSPDLPFRYLAGDGIWETFEIDGITQVRREIRVSDMGKVFARFAQGFETVAADPENRSQLRNALISRYFPWATDSLSLANNAELATTEKIPTVSEESTEYGRSPAFRRAIIEIYDHQCAACGLRIRLPVGNDISFIDAAHLIPFAVSRNDHPTNGLALCKNHHWAMDRNLIAPSPDLHWRASPVLDERRSNGERDLFQLSGKSVLLPKNPAFHPDSKGLNWRLERLLELSGGGFRL
ncbi:MAG: HNH endonuclease [Verrucomicrobiales bacterium]|nr:HNH endonuclease [Verrucomicrobiales bacterium]HQW28828.1 HNH endonuclease [Verrucomicrobiales bacterium]